MRANRQTSGLRADALPAVDDLKHDIARTQDSVDSVHGTLALVVDRLAKIEGDIRAGRAAIAEEAAPAPPVGKLAVRAVSDAPPTMPLAPEPPPPPQQPRMPEPQFAAHAQFAPQAEAAPAPPPMPEAAPLELHESQIHEPPPPPPPPPRRRVASTLPLEPDLPPDQPLEPGSGPPKFGARIAASEAALRGAAPPPAGTAGGKSSFIAAARRAAKAALQQGQRAPVEPDEPQEFDTGERRSLPGKLMKRMKSLFVAAGIIGLVAGGAQILGSKLNLGGGTQTAKTAKTGKLETDKRAKLAHAASQAPQVQIGLSPDPDRMTTSTIPPLAAPAAESAPAYNLGIAGQPPSLFNPPNLAAPASTAAGDITGSIAHNVTPPASTGRSGLDGADLPHAIGSAKLRSAAVAGDAAAQYEVASRFAEGRGVPASLSKAARWFERAAGKGLAPAQFRYASMLEKGQGVKKDLAAARRLYLAAATRGNAKAMHNLAVLYAEGINGKPDYATAVKWFRKAARRGIADSQYNLGVLDRARAGHRAGLRRVLQMVRAGRRQGRRREHQEARRGGEPPRPRRSLPRPSRRSRPSSPSRSRRWPPSCPSRAAGGTARAPAPPPKAHPQAHRQQQQQQHGNSTRRSRSGPSPWANGERSRPFAPGRDRGAYSKVPSKRSAAGCAAGPRPGSVDRQW